MNPNIEYKSVGKLSAHVRQRSLKKTTLLLAGFRTPVVAALCAHVILIPVKGFDKLLHTVSQRVRPLSLWKLCE